MQSLYYAEHSRWTTKSKCSTRENMYLLRLFYSQFILLLFILSFVSPFCFVFSIWILPFCTICYVRERRLLLLHLVFRFNVETTASVNLCGTTNMWKCVEKNKYDFEKKKWIVFDGRKHEIYLHQNDHTTISEFR